MSVKARLRSGGVVTLDPNLGETPNEVVCSLTEKSLTGSAEQFVEDTDGALIRFSEVIRMWESG